METVQWLAWIGWGIVFCISFPIGAVEQFCNNKSYQHRIFATMLILFLLWRLRAGISDDLTFHFLGMTALTLIYGWRMACVIGTIPAFGMVVLGLVPWSNAGLYLLTTVTLPALISYSVFLLSYYCLTRHLFVYIFVAAFLNGAVAIAANLLITACGVWFVGSHSWHYISDNYLQLLPLVLFPEALLNGMTITLLVVYRPQWVCTFAERDYFDPTHKF